jgi:phosphoribosylglycinamide formyltransferase-1
MTGSDGTADGARIAIVSAQMGGHVEALLEDPVIRPWIALVVAPRADAYALREAGWHGVAAVSLRAGKSYLDLYDRALERSLEEHRIDHVVVTGFHRIVGETTVHAFQGRIARVHHSLLPEFPGPDPVADALADGATETGVTVYVIGPDLGVGAIVSQQAIEIHDGDDWHSLVTRMHELERQLLPSAVRALVEGTYPGADPDAGAAPPAEPSPA